MCASGHSSNSLAALLQTENGMASPGEYNHPDREGRLANEHVLARITFKPMMKNILIPKEARQKQKKTRKHTDLSSHETSYMVKQPSS